MLRSLVLVVLLCITSVSPSFIVPNCPNDTVLQQVGSLAYSSGNVVCPHFTNIPGSQWRYNDIGSPVTSPINYSADQVCLFNGTVLVVNPERFANQSNGNLTFFDSSGGNVTFLFAAIGIYRYLTPSNIILTEGNSSRIQFLIYTVAPSVNYLFYRVNQDGTETLLFNSSSASSIRVPPFTFSPFGRSPCQETDESGSVRPQLLDIRVNDISVSDSGQFRTVVLINNMNLSTDVNITVVLPLESSPTASPTSVMSFTLSSPSPSPSLSPSLPITTSTVTASSTPSEPSGPTTQRGTLILYVVVAVLSVVAVAVLLALITVIAFCCYKCRHTNNSHSIEGIIPQETVENGYSDEKGSADGGVTKAGSTSSRQSVTSSQRRSSGHETPKQDYTGIYCSERYSQTWLTLKEKHGKFIKQAEDDDEIYSMLQDCSCKDVHMYADPDDEVLVAVMSRGIPTNREKLNWWHFVSKDKTPDNTIEVEGFRILQVERVDDEMNMIQMGLLKAECPPLNVHRNGDVIHEIKQTRGSTAAAAASTPSRGHDQIDGTVVYKLTEAEIRKLIETEVRRLTGTEVRKFTESEIQKLTEALEENTAVHRRHVEVKEEGNQVQVKSLELHKKEVELQEKILEEARKHYQVAKDQLGLAEATLVLDEEQADSFV